MKYGFEVEDEDGDSDEVAQEDAEEDEVEDEEEDEDEVRVADVEEDCFLLLEEDCYRGLDSHLSWRRNTFSLSDAFEWLAISSDATKSSGLAKSISREPRPDWFFFAAGAEPSRAAATDSRAASSGR